MKSAAAAVVLAACLYTAAARSEAGVTPVEKVLTMLGDMLERAKSEKHAEQVQFSSYNQWCGDSEAAKQQVIKDTILKIELLEADLQTAEAEIDRLGKEITEHEAEVAGFENETEVAAADRATQREEYTVTHQDYTDSISAIQQAIAVLKSKAQDTPQATALLQRVQAAARIPKAARKKIDAFLAAARDPDAGFLQFGAAPEANAYEFQSGGIIDMLEELLDKFKDERLALEKEEVEKRHAYESLDMGLRHSIATGKKAITSKTENKLSQEKAAAQAKGDLEDAQKSKADDEEYLKGLTAECQEKSTDFEARQELRAEEIEALEKAIEIIGGDAVAGNAKKHLPSMVQKRTSFAQLRRSRDEPTSLVRVAEYLSQQGNILGSRVLSVLAANARSDPFEKVKKMIEDLIARLEAQAQEEADHKAWCDEELATNEATRTEKTALADTLRAEIDELTASVAKLAQEIAELQAQVAEISAAVAKATELRAQEEEKNSITIKDAQESQVAVGEAITILQDFYAKAADATALLQRHAKDPETVKPKIFTKPMTGVNQDQSTGVIGMLEVIKSDFARLESETTTAEETAAADHKVFLEESEASKAQKETDIEHKTNEKTTQEADIVEKKQNLETTETELAAANAYFEKLKPSCLESGHTHEQRVQRREEEIQALQEALRILSGEELP